MDKFNLKDVTLACIDCRNPLSTVKAFEHTLELCEFPYVKLFTNIKTFPVPGVEIVQSSVKSFEEYSRFCVFDLAACVDTSHCLIIQHDGFVVNPKAWTDEFLNYDYIGAPWAHIENKVGNGGFSLRSKKLLVAGRSLKVNNYNPEDRLICIDRWPHFAGQGCSKAPYELATRFSCENMAYTGSFGFHGNQTMETIKL